MKKFIIVTILLALSGGVVLAVNHIILPIESFKDKDLGIVNSPTEFSLDEEGVKTGFQIPVTYDFPVEEGTGYILEQRTENIQMNFDAYNKCRSTKNKTVCLGELNDDIQQNKDTFKINKEKELEDLKLKDFKDELPF